MDVIEHLVQEHRSVEQLLQRLADSDPGEERRRTVDELVDSLSTHMAVEERFVYPIVVEVAGEEDEREAHTEHDLARQGLQQLRELVDQPGFGAAVDMVTAGIAHHVHEEEHEVFPTLRADAADAVAALGPPDELERAVRGGGGGVGPDEDLTKEELYERAREAGIEGRSSMDKAELAEALEAEGA